MKNIFVFLILSLLGLKCNAQVVLNTDGLNNINNVYLYSLEKYCETLDSLETKIVYVRDEDFIGKSWPTMINGYEIKYLKSKKDYKQAYKKNKKHFTIVGISTLNLRKAKFYIDIIPFSTTYSKGMYNLGNGGGLTIYFDYDDKKGGLIYKEKKTSGI
ncbi:hypothetical protein FMM05_17145 [Flavobacterium zepuense]|uniref:Uncharacterized protein n=1 Tax=Flavobacterium zepuense TaxID=2593302 RepID=A0A552UWM9_9FLAO|nr:hypothetical protein [Flavobacterium zepuense]TRW22605.1 hypothetical protein FMM05_17145 [Flavobacterium zepuense]